MNYDVFLQGFRLQLSRFQSGKILHFPYGSNSQSHKNMFSRSFRDGKTQHTSNSLNYSLRREDRGEFCAFWQPYLLPWLGETVLSTNKGQVAVSFRKLKCLTKVTIVMKRSEPLCFSHRFKSPTIQLSHGNKKKIFCHQVPICGFTITCIPAFQSCVKTHVGHSEQFHEKGAQGRLFCECWISYLWLSCLGETKCYMNYQQEVTNSLFLLKNFKYFTRAVVVIKIKMNQDVFLAG